MVVALVFRSHGVSTGRGLVTLFAPFAARYVRFCQVRDCRFSLDEYARKFLTASAPTAQPDLAPALVKQGIQPTMLKRKRVNSSRPV